MNPADALKNCLLNFTIIIFCEFLPCMLCVQSSHPPCLTTLMIWSRVYGSVTNHNGFWIGFIDTFFVHSLLITINYKDSHSIFSRTLLPWLPRTRSILILILRLSPLYFVVLCSVLFYNSSARTPRKTLVICKECLCICSLPSNGCPSLVESVTSGMFLPSRCLAMINCVTILLW
jgi:hypothetical protein